MGSAIRINCCQKQNDDLEQDKARKRCIESDEIGRHVSS